MAQAISPKWARRSRSSRGDQVPSGTWHIRQFHHRRSRTSNSFAALGPHAPNDRIAMEPIGVVGLITPWNWPMNQVTLKVIPALLAGCTMVLKPSEIAPLSSIVFAEIVHAAGLPKGVFNLVNGDWRRRRHRSVDPPGCRDDQLHRLGPRGGLPFPRPRADTFKRVCLELGGKGANLDFSPTPTTRRWSAACAIASTTPARAATRRPACWSSARSNDQTVGKGRRGRRNRQGRPGARGSAGISARSSRPPSMKKIQGLIQKGIDEGARLVAGGVGRPDGLKPRLFRPPHHLCRRDQRHDHRARRRSSGRSCSIIPFDDEENAVEIANDTIYGLTNYVAEPGRPPSAIVWPGACAPAWSRLNGKSRGAGAPFGRRQGLGPGPRGKAALGDRGIPRSQGHLRLGQRLRNNPTAREFPALSWDSYRGKTRQN